MDTTITLENGHKIWTKQIGDGPGLPLLLPHGGPGAGHDYLESLAAIGDERPIIFHDQLGCGKSDIPGNPFLWTIERLAILRSEGLKTSRYVSCVIELSSRI